MNPYLYMLKAILTLIALQSIRGKIRAQDLPNISLQYHTHK